MITAECNTSKAVTFPRQQSLRINDFGFDYVRFTIFDTDYSITDVALFIDLFTPAYSFTTDESNTISMSYDCPNPNQIDWKAFIFRNYDAKKREVM